MQRKTSHKTVAVFSILTVALALAPGAWAGATKKILYSFKGGSDGKYPTYPGLIFDKAGNLYGTTSNGGTYGFGTVFELKAHADGGWSEVVLHSFAGGRDGAFPSTGLAFDNAGNLYGATPFGGGLGRCSFEGFSSRQRHLTGFCLGHLQRFQDG